VEAPLASPTEELTRLRQVAQELEERVAECTRELAIAQEALRECERNSRVVVDSIPGLVALLSAGGEVQFVNRQIFDYTGRTFDEIKQWGTNDIVHPEDLPHVIRVFTQSIVSGTPYEILQRLRRSDGVYRWFQNNGFSLRDARGEIDRWSVLLTDVDERKRAEDALRESERESRLIVDSIPGLLAAFTPAGELEFVNRQILEYFGMTLEQLKHWGDGGMTHPDDLPGIVERFAHAMESGQPFEFELRARRFDGVYRWFESRGLPLRDTSGQIVRWYNLLIDIDERKRAEEELLRAYDHLTEAQRLSQTGSFTSDLERDEHFWSDEFYRICGFEPGSPISIQKLGEVVHPEDVALYEGAIGRALAGTDPDFYFRIVTSSGVVKHLRGFAHRIEDRPVFVGAVQDVTASKMAQEALNRAGAELAHVSRVTTLSALTASIAHEVNQPLSGIITNAGTCLRMLDATPPDIDGARETARRTIRDGNRASDVITRLRALFTKREFTLEPLDLNEATRELIALSASDLQRNRIVLQPELASDLPMVTGDRIQLQQVILNLLRNASDAMIDVHDRPRQLLIKTERDEGDRVRLTVRDAGVGLPPESLTIHDAGVGLPPRSLNSLFNAFYTTKKGGMGIGLFVSRSIIERHQGRLWAEPNEGGPGTTFSFSIPLAAETVLDGAPAMRTS
jgi:PAS domain S-box-containing protein